MWCEGLPGTCWSRSLVQLVSNSTVSVFVQQGRRQWCSSVLRRERNFKGKILLALFERYLLWSSLKQCCPGALGPIDKIYQDATSSNWMYFAKWPSLNLVCNKLCSVTAVNSLWFSLNSAWRKEMDLPRLVVKTEQNIKISRVSRMFFNSQMWF